MPRNDFLFRVDAKQNLNAFLYAPPARANANNFLYTCYGTNGPVPMSDPDALAYATAGNILAQPEREALNALVVALKASGLWNKLHAVYPFTPNATALNIPYSLNLKNIAQHQLTIPSDFVCTPEGLRNNSNTSLQCSSNTLNWDVVAVENLSLGVYYRTYGRNDSAQVDIAISNGTTQSFLQSRNATGAGLANEAGFLHYVGGDSRNQVNGLAGSPGLHVLTRNNLVTTYYVESRNIASNGAIGVLVAQPTGGLLSLGNKAVAPISFAFVGQSLTASEISSLQSIIDTYQSSLTVPRRFTVEASLNTNTAAFYQTAQLARWRHAEILDNLVTGLQTDALWSLITLLYPFVGETALAHSVNLRNPSQYPITWGGSLQHTSQGVVGTSSSGGIGTTNYTPTTNEAYLGLYVNQSTGPQAAHDWGAFVDGGVSSDLHYQWMDQNTYVDLGSQLGSGRTQVTNPQTTGYRAGSRWGTTQSIYYNSSEIHTAVRSDNNVTAATYKLFRGSTNPCPNRTYALAVAGLGLTPTQHTQLYNRIQAFQTALGRAV